MTCICCAIVGRILTNRIPHRRRNRRQGPVFMVMEELLNIIVLEKIRRKVSWKKYVVCYFTTIFLFVGFPQLFAEVASENKIVEPLVR